MRVVLICHDKPDHLQTRLDNRPAHLAHIEASGVVEMAGPFLDPQGRMTGSMIVLNVETLADADRWVANDPYAKSGLFDSLMVSEWRKVMG